MYPLVTAYTQWSGIHKTDTGTRSQQYRLDKDGHRKEDFPFQLYKTVIRHPFGKQIYQMLTDIFKVEVLETSVSTGMKKNHDKHDFRITHSVGFVTMLSILLRTGEHMIFLIFCKFFAEIVC
jgi:hypothetical protein